MEKVVCALFLYFSLVNCQVKNVNLVHYVDYFEDFSNEVVKIMEEKSWSNLKMLDIDQDISATIFGQTFTGTVKYTNGFVDTIQGLDIFPSQLKQVVHFVNKANPKGEVAGTIRMNDVAVGFDAEANINNKKLHYTGVTTFSHIDIEFIITKDYTTNEISTECKTTAPLNGSPMMLLPKDLLAETISATYDIKSANDGVATWSDAFQIVSDQIVKTKVLFPEICYNCPVES